MLGWSHFTDGDFPSAINCFQRAIQISADPYYSQFPRLELVYSYVSNGQFQEAHEDLQEVLAFSQKFGVEILGTPTHGLLGLVLIGKGHLSRGIKMLEDAQRTWLEKQRRCLYAASDFDLGLLHTAKGKEDQAGECISRAIQVFEQCEAETYLRQAKEALENFG